MAVNSDAMHKKVSISVSSLMSLTSPSSSSLDMLGPSGSVPLMFSMTPTSIISLVKRDMMLASSAASTFTVPPPRRAILGGVYPPLLTLLFTEVTMRRTLDLIPRFLPFDGTATADDVTESLKANESRASSSSPSVMDAQSTSISDAFLFRAIFSPPSACRRATASSSFHSQLLLAGTHRCSFSSSTVSTSLSSLLLPLLSREGMGQTNCTLLTVETTEPSADSAWSRSPLDTDDSIMDEEERAARSCLLDATTSPL
mmetsp:Transcript_2864/g.7259  ORF Transcript_2864/g.7259 Transcript_2864/m.7259 type:complete len:257 (-) Transcript_2864:1858-2628(-)